MFNDQPKASKLVNQYFEAKERWFSRYIGLFGWKLDFQQEGKKKGGREVCRTNTVNEILHPSLNLVLYRVTFTSLI